SVNLILGFPSLILDADVPLWTQVEYAVAMNPTLALVELGYEDAIDATVSGDPSRMPSPSDFQANYDRVVSQLASTFATVVLTTIPDPTATAYFSSVALTSRRLSQPASFFQSNYLIADTDLISEAGVRDISTQLLLKQAAPLAPGRVLAAPDAARIR